MVPGDIWISARPNLLPSGRTSSTIVLDCVDALWTSIRDREIVPEEAVGSAEDCAIAGCDQIMVIYVNIRDGEMVRAETSWLVQEEVSSVTIGARLLIQGRA